MKTLFALSAVLGALALSGCVMPETDAAMPVTGGDLTGATARNCTVAIARTANRSPADVAVFDVAESEAGNTAQATLAGKDAPWICRTDSSGRVLQVMYSAEG